MNNSQRAIVRILFENKIRASDGQAFEDLFTAIMAKANPNFTPVKPQGPIGDRKNDGYDRVQGIYYQVFAPEDIRLSASEAIRKAQRDFAGLKSYWDTILTVKEYVFVLNDKYNGAYPTILDCLAEIKRDYHLDDCRPLLAKDLEEILFKLPDDVIQSIVGPIQIGPETKRTPVKSRLPKPQWCYGREADIATLAKALHENKTAAVTQAIAGLGGVGKTTLALEYAHRYEDDYDFLLFALADSVSSLERDYRAIADQVALPIPDDAKAVDVVRAVKDWLNSTPRTFLILDNTDFSPTWTPEQLKAFLPEKMVGHLLITTRAMSLHGGLGITKSRVLSLDVMLEEEAMNFLIARARGEGAILSAEEANAAAKLANALGYLPLALEQAAAFIAQPGRMFVGYFKRYLEVSIEQLERSKPETSDYRHTIATTWQINFDEVTRDCPAAANLLNLCAFLAPERIPMEVVYGAALKTVPTVQMFFVGVKDDEAALERYYDLLQPLIRYSLVTVDAGKRIFGIHRLVQEVIRWRMTEEAYAAEIARAVQTLDVVFLSPEFENWATCERLTVCVLALSGYVKPEIHGNETVARLYNQTAIYLYNRGRYIEAEPLIVEALNMHCSALPEGHPSIAASLNNLAWLYRIQGRFIKAEPLLVEALKILRTALPEEHPDIARNLNNLAELYIAQKRYTEAEPLIVEALNIHRTAHPEGHPNIWQSLNNLAGLYLTQRRYNEAEPPMVEALTILRASLPEEHPMIATILNNLAGLYKNQKRYGDAEPLFAEALRIRCTVLPEGHPDIAQSIHNLAGLYAAQGRYNEAEPMFNEALRIRRAALPEGHPYIVSSLNNLAGLYNSQGRYNDAKLLMVEALKFP